MMTWVFSGGEKKYAKVRPCHTAAAAVHPANRGEGDRPGDMSEEHPGREGQRAAVVPEPVSAPRRPTAVGFDIETTGIGEDDIVTIACVWSPDKQREAFYGDDFTEVLRMLDDADLIYTYNGIEFDLPRLAKHCKRDMAPWMRKTVDPLYMMKHTMGFGGCRKLNDLLVLNGFEPKSGSGLQAVQFWHNGERDKLSSYCMDDARLTYLLCECESVQWTQRWRVHMREARVLSFVR